MPTVRPALALTVFAVLCGSALPQDPVPERDPVVRVSVPQTGFVLKEGDIAVEELVAKAAAFLGANILLEPVALAQNPPPITLTKALELDVHGCWDVLSQLLWTRGLVLVPLDEQLGLWEVLSTQQQRRSEIGQRAIYVDRGDLPRYANRYVPIETTIQLEHANAQLATNALRPFFAASGSSNAASLQIGTAGDQRSLLVQGLGIQVAAAARMITEMDQASGTELGETRFAVVPLEHVDAEELTVRIQSVTGSRQQPQAGGYPSEPFRIVAAPGQNAVLLSGLAEDIEKVKLVIATLDAPVAGAKRPSDSGAGARDDDTRFRQLEAQIEALQKQVDELRKQADR